MRRQSHMPYSAGGQSTSPATGCPGGGSKPRSGPKSNENGRVAQTTSSLLVGRHHRYRRPQGLHIIAPFWGWETARQCTVCSGIVRGGRVIHGRGDGISWCIFGGLGMAPELEGYAVIGENRQGVQFDGGQVREKRGIHVTAPSRHGERVRVW